MISDVSIRRPVSTFVLTVMIVALGVFFLRSLSVDLLPDITYPLIRIIIDWKGASPEEIEENILERVEASVATTEDAIEVISSAIEGNGSIEVYFEYGKDMDVALADTRAKLDLVRNELPPDADEPKIYKADPSQLPIIDIALFSKTKDERELRDWAENDLSDYFLGIPGLGAVAASGGRVREIQVVIDREKVERYELSADTILDLLRRENVEYPAGRISDAKREYSVRLLAKFKNVSEIGDIIIANREGRFLRIKDVARVSDAHEEQRVLTRFDGEPSVIVSFLKQPNANTVEVARRIEDRASELRKKGVIPDAVAYEVVSSQASYIEHSIWNVGLSAVIGGILAMLTIWFFLHDLRRTLVIAVAIPVSILGTFILMGLFGVTLNIFSLGGLVVAVGMLVDNSVVMLENITRHQSDASGMAEAAHIGSEEVAGALVASSFTNVAAIIPFFLITGIAALLFRDMVVTVMVAFILSLLVCLTVVPCLAAHLFRMKRAVQGRDFSRRFMEKVAAIYRRALGLALNHRAAILGGAAALFVMSLFLIGVLGSEFLPQIDDGRITVKLKLPIGSSLEQTDAAVKEIEAIVGKMPGVDNLSSMIGGYWQRRNVYEKANEAEITVELVEKSKRPLSTGEFIRKLRKKLKEISIPGAKKKVMPTKLRGIKKTSTSDIDIRVRGHDFGALFNIAEEIQRRIKDVEGVANLDTSIDFSKPEIHVTLDREKLGDFGLTAEDVSDVARVSVDGMVSTQFTDKSRNVDYDVRVLADPLIVSSAEAIEDTPIYPPSGAPVKLGEVAKVEVSEGPVQIDREDQVRLISVLADAEGRNVGKVTEEVKARLKGLTLPSGYVMEFGGEEEAVKESSGQLMVVVALAIFLVFVVMAVLYESLLDPLIIMMTVPLAVIGSFLLLALTGTSFGATVFLGLILLVGIVVNNAIVLVDFINGLRRGKGHSVLDAVIEGASLRLRPILMTSITTIVGLMPLALGWGEGLEMLRPLAITVAGGLAASMFLTLFVIPCVYTVFHRGSEAGKMI